MSSNSSPFAYSKKDKTVSTSRKKSFSSFLTANLNWKTKSGPSIFSSIPIKLKISKKVWADSGIKKLKNKLFSIKEIYKAQLIRMGKRQNAPTSQKCKLQKKK